MLNFSLNHILFDNLLEVLNIIEHTNFYKASLLRLLWLDIHTFEKIYELLDNSLKEKSKIFIF
jgi:hypothetical protein